MCVTGAHDPVEDFVTEVARVDDRAERERLFLKHAEAFGVSRFAYLSTSPGDEPWYFETNYPSEWVERYVDKSYVEVDVVPLHSRRTPAPFNWRSALALPQYGAEAEEVFHDSAAFGIHDGYSIPIHGGGGFALVSMAVDDPSMFRRSARGELYALQLLGLHFHLACERAAAKAPPPSVTLTPREREVLSWAAKGKTAWEIAHILHLAERTVVFHMENAKTKLGAATRSHAVVRAVGLGLIAP